MKKIIYILSILLLFASCQSKSKFEIDTSQNRKEVKIHRFDLDLINIDTVKPLEAYVQLKDKYPQFLPLYTHKLIGDSMMSDEKRAEEIMNFVTYPSMVETNRKVKEIFIDVSSIENQLSDAFTYVVHYFPNIRLPKMYFFVSGLNIPMIVNRDFSILGVGTDFYLGKDYKPYQAVVYDYMLNKMEPTQIPVDVVSAVLLKNFPYDSEQNRLLDNMLYHGKIVYLSSIFMEEMSIRDIMSYTDEQMEWAEKNEEQIWRKIVGNKELYTSDLHLISKYINDAPFTAPISQESPGRLGIWIGFKIVESYMNNNKDVSLQRLMQEHNYQQLLQQSGY